LTLPKVGTIEQVSPAGKVLDTMTIPAGPSGAIFLTGMLFVPGTGLYVADGANSFGNPKAKAGRLLLVDPVSHAVKTVASGFNSLNNLAMDRQKNLYLGDLGTGTIYKMGTTGHVTLWAHDPLLGSIKGAPGVDGIAFDPTQKYLYATNPGGHELVRIPVNANGTAGKASVFASGAAIDAAQHTTLALNGPDGLQVDTQGNIWVAVSWVNQIQEISPTGTLLARYGSQGAARLYNPCSLVFVGKTLYFSNLSLGIQPSGQLAAGKPYPPGRIGALQAPYPGLPLAF
jgi:sugar lactone lactonase YvrE